MDIFIESLPIFIVGIVASFIGAITGGGGLLSVPFLIFVGLPPHVAIATNRFGALGLSIGALAKFHKEKQISWRWVAPFAILAIIAGILGSKILITIDAELLEKIIAIVILIFLPLLFIKKDFGVVNQRVGLVKKFFGTGAYFLILIYGGFIGAGGGILVIYALVFFFGFSMIRANATDFVPWAIMSVVSLAVFIIEGIVDYSAGISLFLGMLIWGYLGAHVAVKKGNKWVKTVFAIFVIAFSMKLLFFS